MAMRAFPIKAHPACCGQNCHRHSLTQPDQSHTQNSELGTPLSPRKACLYGKGASQRGHGLSHDALLTSLRIHSWVLSKVPVSSLCLSNHCGLLGTSAWWTSRTLGHTHTHTLGHSVLSLGCMVLQSQEQSCWNSFQDHVSISAGEPLK